MQRFGTSTRAFLTGLILAGSLAGAGLAMQPRVAMAQREAANPVASAQALYDEAKFNDAIVLLRDALRTGKVTGGDIVGARELLARCLVKAGNRVEAKEAFLALLRTDPDYRADALRTPPDEMDVFNLALKDFTAEQIEAGRRIPASIAFHFGTGSADNKDWGQISQEGGGPDKLEGSVEGGGSVRFPIRPRWSFDIEVTRLRATASDTMQTEYIVSALPAVVSLYYNAVQGSKFRVNVFGGVGPMLSSSSTIKFAFFSVRLSLAAAKTGVYAHGGVEGEYLLSPRFALNARVLGRYAKATNIDFGNPDLTLYSTQKIGGRDIDFSGYGAYVGMRAYIGY